jgi:hypothetical protein
MSSSAEAEGLPNDVRKPPVVAGVDGSDSARHAGEWAAELRRRGALRCTSCSGFRPAGCDLRYTIGPWAQREILDRLLELNHERYAEEVAKGLHDKKKARTARAPKKSDVEGLF